MKTPFCYPHVSSPHSYYVRHLPSDVVRRVATIRIWFDGTMTFQFFTGIKFDGDTIFQADSSECSS